MRFSPNVIDHFTNPRNSGRLSKPDASAFIGNPVCGDQILLTAHITDDIINAVEFEAFGCSASLAIASILTERLRDLAVDQLLDIDATDVVKWAGGLSPDQHHVAQLGADVTARLAHNYRNGITEDGSASCNQ